MNTHAPQLWHEHESTDVSDEEFRHILMGRARFRANRFRILTTEYERVRMELEQERQYIEDLNRLLHAEGLTPVDLSSAPSSVLNGDSLANTDKPLFTPGNRSDRLPPRRPEYAGMSLPEAAKRILERGNTLHVNDILKEIYDVQSPAQRQAARASLGSTLANGAKRGIWQRGQEQATFRMPDKEERET